MRTWKSSHPLRACVCQNFLTATKLRSVLAIVNFLLLHCYFFLLIIVLYAMEQAADQVILHKSNLEPGVQFKDCVNKVS